MPLELKLFLNMFGRISVSIQNMSTLLRLFCKMQIHGSPVGFQLVT